MEQYERFLAATPHRRQRQREETPAPPAGSLTTYREGMTCPLCGNCQVVRRTTRVSVNYLGCSSFRPGAAQQDCPFTQARWWFQAYFKFSPLFGEDFQFD